MIFNTTVDSILKPLSKLVARLEAHADKHTSLASSHTAEIDRLTSARQAAHAERNAALAAAQNIRGLFS